MLSSKKVPIEFQSNPKKFKKNFKVKKEKSIKFYPKIRENILVSPDIKFMSLNQIVVVLKIIKPALKKISRRALLKLDVRPDEILTKKPKDIRMGRGKGIPTDKVAIVGTKPFLSIYRAKTYLVNKLLSRCSKKINNSKQLKLYKW